MTRRDDDNLMQAEPPGDYLTFFGEEQTEEDLEDADDVEWEEDTPPSTDEINRRLLDIKAEVEKLKAEDRALREKLVESVEAGEDANFRTQEGHVRITWEDVVRVVDKEAAWKTLQSANRIKDAVYIHNQRLARLIRENQGLAKALEGAVRIETVPRVRVQLTRRKHV